MDSKKEDVVRPEIAFIFAGVVIAFIVATVVTVLVLADALTDDEYNQLPRCDSAQEVLVGSGNFYAGQWDTYSCVRLDE